MRARRLARSHLLERAPPERLVDVVGDTCGIHVQVMTAGELALAARVDGVAQQDVRDELWTRRGLVKAATLRGTLHLHPPEELPVWVAARSAFPRDGGAWWFREQGITDGQRRELAAAAEAAVGGEPVTRAEVAEAVVARVGEWAREPASTSWNFLVGGPGQVYGPNRGRNVTFVRAEAWTGRAWQELDPRAALADALRRYLRAYAPAAPADFAHWFGLKAAQAAELFASLGDELEEVRLEGRRAFVLTADADFPDEPLRTVRLLPSYDVYVIGAHPRDLLIPGHEKLVFDRGAGPLPTLLVDGAVAGVWRHERRGRRFAIRLRPFAPLATPARRALDGEVARIADFLAADVSLDVA